MNPAETPADPWTLLRTWYEEAQACEQIRYAHAVCLATVDEDEQPDARMLLMHELQDDAIVFSTDTRSAKARQLADRPNAALLFYWEALERQVRVRGVVEEGDEELAERCFVERPRKSRITAWASHQSRSGTREALEARYRETQQRFQDVDVVPCPPHWRAWRLLPTSFEFWQAAAARLHHRTLYTRQGDDWTQSLLEP